MRSKRLPIGLVLAGLTALLVLAATAGISTIAAGLLRRLAEQQAAAHVDLGARVAGEMVERTEAEVLAAAQVLAERPTLDRLLREEDYGGTAAFLARFCAPGGHSACAVLQGDAVLAASPAAAALPPPLAEGVSGFSHADGRVSIVASAKLDGRPGTVAVVARELDTEFAEAIAAQIGMRVRIVAPSVVGGNDVGVGRHTGGFHASVPLAGGTAGAGADVPRLEVALPAADIDRSVRTLLTRLLLAALVIVGAAAACAVLIGRVVSRPMRSLATSARRIGDGDLATPVTRVAGHETARLAESMEDMRRRLFALTGELSRSQADAQALLDGIVEGVFSVDERRRVQYLNPQAAALLDLDAAAAIGRFCGDVLRPAPVNGVRPCDIQCPIVHARSRGSTRATELIQLGNGRRRTVVITSSEPSEGRQVQVLRDETDIEGARRARDAIVANISHEFRTPLSAQLASLELLREQVDATDGTGELVRAIERGSLRLVQLVDNLLESVRLESGEDSILLRPLAIDEVVEEAVEALAPLTHQRGQGIEVAMPWPLPTVLGDPQRLTQVIVNLLANASKYAPEGTTIWITAETAETLDGQGGEMLRLAVTDEGPGLPVGSETSIFDRFYRAGEPPVGGMGLGLWIVKSIVERHGGTVHARTTPVGGARFTIALPVVDA